MIVDLQRFVDNERPYWDELTALLDELERDAARRLTLAEAERFHYLYQRAAAGLTRLASFPAAGRIRDPLEALVSRAYAEIHESRGGAPGLAARRWLTATFPQTFRRRLRAFELACAVTLAGGLLGAFLIWHGESTGDPMNKQVLMPFPHLRIDPAERVEAEEAADEDRLEGHAGRFAGMLMTHNIKVSLLAMGLGMSWALGTVILLFHNGVLLGAVALDYVLAGETVFLLGWLMPHGVIEIPAVLLAGQAGIVLGGALIGRGAPVNVKARLREAAPDIATLIGGVALLLVWAGIVEAFVSQYHEPKLPYWLKIAFGGVEFAALCGYLGWAGRGSAAKSGETRRA